MAPCVRPQKGLSTAHAQVGAPITPDTPTPTPNTPIARHSSEVVACLIEHDEALPWHTQRRQSAR
jgi:hypothetical protein